MKTWLVGLGAVAFVSALAMEIWRRTEDTKLTSQQAMFREEAQWVMNGIESQLQNADTCTRMLGGISFVPLSAAPVALNYNYDNGYPAPLKAASPVTGGLILDEVTLESAYGHAVPADPANGADMKTQSALYPDEKLTRFPVRLHMSIATKDRTMTSTFTGPPGLTKPFYIWVNTAGTIVTCFGRESVGAFCNSIGGFYHYGAGEKDRADLACRQSVFTSQWVDNQWNAKGSCRYGGVVPNSELCARRFGSEFEPVQLQAAIPTGGMDDYYMCMSCK